MHLKMKKDQGIVQYIFCIMFICIIAILMLYNSRARIIEMQKMTIEDGITTSALASALVDVNEYGKYQYIRSGSNNEWDQEEWQLFNIFKKTLQNNLNLDSSMKPKNANGILTSKVVIKNFWIYNHELSDTSDNTNNSNNNLIKRHVETPNFMILKYIGDDDGGYTITKEKFVPTSEHPNLLTPKDTHIISNDANSVDGIGAGEQIVDNMTIYVTLEFEVNPFGIGLQSDDSEFFGYSSLVGNQKITKSIVVDVDKLIN